MGERVLDAAEADLEPFDFTDPAFAFRFDDAGFEVVADLRAGSGLKSAVGGAVANTAAARFMGERATPRKIIGWAASGALSGSLKAIRGALQLGTAALARVGARSIARRSIGVLTRHLRVAYVIARTRHFWHW